LKSFKHWTPRYFVDRLSYFRYRRIHPDIPWLTQNAVSFLKMWLKSSDIGLEWGCGKSTIFFSKRVKHLTSIEHDKEWYMRVKNILKSVQIQNVDLLYREHIDDRKSEYVRYPGSFPKASFDFVLVDGKHRGQCMKVAIELVRLGDILILDNANRYLPSDSRAPDSLTEDISTEFREIMSQLASWRSIWTSNGLWDTAIWVKN